MKKFWMFIFIAGVAIVIVSALSHTYIGTAFYDAIETNTFQSSYDRVQSRKQQQAEWDLQQLTRKQSLLERSQISSEIVSGWKTYIPFLFAFGTLCTCVVLYSVTHVVLKLGEATADRAMLVSRQISMDPETGSYPLLISEDGKYLLDINSFSSMETGKEYIPQLEFVDRANRIRRLTIIGFNMARKNGGQDVIFPVLEEKYE